jgi:hypothetical protein
MISDQIWTNEWMVHYNGNGGPEGFNGWPIYMLAYDNGVWVTWAEESEKRRKKKMMMMMMMPNQTWTKCCSLNNACIHGLRAKRAKVAAVNDGFLKISLLQKIYIYIYIYIYISALRVNFSFHNENQRACSTIFHSHSDIIITSSRSWSVF